MTESNSSNQALLQETIQRLQSLPQKVQDEVRSKATAGSPVLSCGLVLENTAKLLELFPCLSESEAGSLLADRSSDSRFPINTYVSRMTPYVDTHYERLSSQIWLAERISGGFGKQVLGRVLREVNSQRRSRNAVEVLQLESLLQIHRNQLMEEQKRSGKTFTQDELDAKVVKDYPQAVAAYLAAIGSDCGDLILGSMTMKDLSYLREIKQFLRERAPKLQKGEALPYFRKVGDLLEKARQRGMGPMTAEGAYVEQQRRKQHPNVLFEPLDGRGPAKWGGVYPSITKKVTVQVAKANGEVGPSVELKVLSNQGRDVLKAWKDKYLWDEFSSEPSIQQKQALQIEKKTKELLAMPRDKGMWLINVLPGDIGFDLVDREIEVTGPDFGTSIGLDKVSMSDAVAQMMKFQESKGFEAPGGLGVPEHMIP